MGNYTKNIIVISHRRSGTHLTIDSIRNNFKIYKKNTHDIRSLTLDRLNSRYHSPVPLEEFTRNLWESPRVFKTHMHSDVERFFDNCPQNVKFIKNLLSSSKIIYVYRDGRDVLNSLYFYMKSYNPKMRKVSFQEFIRMDNNFDRSTYDGELNRVEYWKFHVKSWLHKENVLYLSFEQFLENYDQTMKKIADFIGEQCPKKIRKVLRRPISHKRILQKLCYRLWNKIFQIQYTSVAFRKGQSGDYLNFFHQEDLMFYDSIAGTLLHDLGYNKNSKWKGELIEWR